MPHRGAVSRGPASLQGWVIVVASFHKLQLIVVHVGQPIHCTCLCISHGLWVLGVGGWAKGWGGGPVQMLSRVYTQYIPGISIYRYIPGIYPPPKTLYPVYGQP